MKDYVVRLFFGTEGPIIEAEITAANAMSAANKAIRKFGDNFEGHYAVTWIQVWRVEIEAVVYEVWA